MKISVKPIVLKLRETFRISREASDTRHNVVVRIIDDSGQTGVGEAAPSVYYNQTAQSVADVLEGLNWPDEINPLCLEDFLSDIKPQLVDQNSGLAALDMAIHDLAGKHLETPLYRLFGLNPEKTPLTSFTIGIASPEEIRRKTEQAADFPILKIKLGSEDDRAIIAAIRDVTSAPLRVDANAAWSQEEAGEKIRWLADQGVELIEQPLPTDDLDGLSRLTETSPLPIIADESCRTPRDVIQLRNCVHGINIKLSKCGGIREAMKMIHVARAQDMKVMLGCFIETSIGITAAAHLSPLADYADLDGNLLIEDQYSGGVRVKEGKLLLPHSPGIGVTMNDPKPSATN